MSDIPTQFSPLQRGIIEGLRRGDEVEDIALRLNTSAQYIYNTRSEARKLRIIFNPPDQQNIQQPAQPVNTELRQGIGPTVPNQTAIQTTTAFPTPPQEYTEAEKQQILRFQMTVAPRPPQSLQSREVPKTSPNPFKEMAEFYAELNRIMMDGIKFRLKMEPIIYLLRELSKNS